MKTMNGEKLYAKDGKKVGVLHISKGKMEVVSSITKSAYTVKLKDLKRSIETGRLILLKPKDYPCKTEDDDDKPREKEDDRIPKASEMRCTDKNALREFFSHFDNAKGFSTKVEMNERGGFAYHLDVIGPKTGASKPVTLVSVWLTRDETGHETWHANSHVMSYKQETHKAERILSAITKLLLGKKLKPDKSKENRVISLKGLKKDRDHLFRLTYDSYFGPNGWDFADQLTKLTGIRWKFLGAFMDLTCVATKSTPPEKDVEIIPIKGTDGFNLRFHGEEDPPKKEKPGPLSDKRKKIAGRILRKAGIKFNAEASKNSKETVFTVGKNFGYGCFYAEASFSQTGKRVRCHVVIINDEHEIARATLKGKKAKIMAKKIVEAVTTARAAIGAQEKARKMINETLGITD